MALAMYWHRQRFLQHCSRRTNAKQAEADTHRDNDRVSELAYAKDTIEPSRSLSSPLAILEFGGGISSLLRLQHAPSVDRSGDVQFLFGV